MSTKGSFRVYFVSHRDGRVSGSLIRRYSNFFDPPPPAAFGESEEDVYRQLEPMLVELEAAENDLERYLWTEEFQTRRVDLAIHPQNTIKGRTVIGKRTIPLRLTFAWAHMPSGAFRVMLPRFDWWYVLEDLDIATEVIAGTISSALLGEKARWVYEFRHEGKEYVRAWRPAMLDRRLSRTHQRSDEESFPVLASIGEELVGKAIHKRLPPTVGMDELLEQYRPLVERERPRSLLLVGGPGVGKSAFVRKLALHFLARQRGKRGARKSDVKRTRLWSSSADRIIAGMVYLGMWQERCLNLVEELSHEGDYLYLDRLGPLLTAQSDGASIADLLAPALAAGEISLIAECDDTELERARQKNAAFVDHFHLVRLDETPAAHVLDIVQLYQQKKRSPLTIHASAYRRAVSHLRVFRRDLCFPGKAIQFFDWLDADVSSQSSGELYPSDMSAAFSRYSGLPVELISDDIPASASAIADRLRARVIGQDHACTTCARVLARFKAGLNDPERPVGTLFFAGPTGVGKTELAKQLARYMFGSADRLIRVDMSEYMNPGASQRLLEVGQGVSSLAENVRKEPLTVVLLDEIEKAHPEVFDLLLGILGEGRLTDSAGRLVDFRMAVIVMTSNLGATQVRTSGFGSRGTRDYLRSVMRHFRPEFFNRLDHILAFRSLERADVERIVDLELASVSRRIGLERRQLRLRLTDAARVALARAGHDPKMGARPLRRVIEERVVTPLAVTMAEDPSFRECEIAIACADEDELAGLSPSARAHAIVL